MMKELIRRKWRWGQPSEPLHHPDGKLRAAGHSELFSWVGFWHEVATQGLTSRPFRTHDRAPQMPCHLNLVTQAVEGLGSYSVTFQSRPNEQKSTVPWPLSWVEYIFLHANSYAVCLTPGWHSRPGFPTPALVGSSSKEPYHTIWMCPCSWQQVSLERLLISLWSFGLLGLRILSSHRTCFRVILYELLSPQSTVYTQTVQPTLSSTVMWASM